MAARVRDLVPEARVAVAHGQMDEGTLEQVVDFWEARTTCWSARRSSSRASTCRRSTRSSSTGPTCSAWASSTSCGAGSGAAAAGLRLPVPPARARADRGGLRAAEDHRRVHRARLGLPASRCATSRSGAPATCSGRPVGHIAAVGYDLYCQMVNEAVSELKGEEPRDAGRDKLDLPVDATSLRLHRGGPAPRGLPAAGGGDSSPRSTTSARSGSDRYGPVPDRPASSSRWPACAPSATGSASRAHVVKGPAFGGLPDRPGCRPWPSARAR